MAGDRHKPRGVKHNKIMVQKNVDSQEVVEIRVGLGKTGNRRFTIR